MAATLVQNALALGSPGAAVDVSAGPDRKTLVYAGGAAGDQVTIESSLDGTNWTFLAFIQYGGAVFEIEQSIKWVRTANALGLTGIAYCNWTFEDGYTSTTVVNSAMDLSVTGGAGAALDAGTAAMTSFKTFQYGGGAEGDILLIQGSPDGTNWVQLKGAAIYGPSGLIEVRSSIKWLRSFYQAGVKASAALSVMTSDLVGGGGGGGAPSGPAGGVLAFTGSTYPNPNGLAFVSGAIPIAGGAGTIALVQPGTPTAGPALIIEAGAGGAADGTTPGGVGGARTDTASAGGAASSAQVGGQGGIKQTKGGVGGAGSALQAAGAGGDHYSTGGSAGTNNGGGGNNGGDEHVNGGAGSGAGNPGNQLLGDLYNGSSIFYARVAYNNQITPTTVVATDTIAEGPTPARAIRATAPRVMTSTPTVAAGKHDGQLLTIVNAGSNAITLQGESSLAGSTLLLQGGTAPLAAFGSIQLMWLVGPGRWIEIGAQTPT